MPWAEEDGWDAAFEQLQIGESVYRYSKLNAGLVSLLRTTATSEQVVPRPAACGRY